MKGGASRESFRLCCHAGETVQDVGAGPTEPGAKPGRVEGTPGSGSLSRGKGAGPATNRC